jgi:hypothetical protein
MRRFDAIEQSVGADIRRTSAAPSRFEFEARYPCLRAADVPFEDIPRGFRDGTNPPPEGGTVVRYSYRGERFHVIFDAVGRLIVIIPTYE